jgi:hypothetical protein
MYMCVYIYVHIYIHIYIYMLVTTIIERIGHEFEGEKGGVFEKTFRE